MKARFLLLIFYVLTTIIAINLVPDYKNAGMQAFEDTSDIKNSITYFFILIIFTAFILFAVKFSEKLILFIFYSIIFITTFYIFLPYMGLLSIIPSLLIISLLGLKKNWIVINLSALILSAGITAIFGISLEPLPAITLLAILAIYDYISVYKTKHMIELADSLTKLNLPLLFIIPSSLTASLDDEKNAYMGVGDVVIPNILVVSAYTFSGVFKAFTTFIGSIIGLLILLYVVERSRKPHPGLPYLNSFAISAYIIFTLLGF